MKLFLVLMLLFFFCNAQTSGPTGSHPPLSRGFPPTWHTWVVTTVKQGSDILYNWGQLISFSSGLYSCRFNQQNLVTPTTARPADFCDFQARVHFSINDTGGACDMWNITETVPPTVDYPTDVVAKAQYVGQDLINGNLCNHYVAVEVPYGNSTVNADMWERISTRYPCQMSFLDLKTKVLTNWAFDGLTPNIPPDSKCTEPQKICEEDSFVCRIMANASDESLAGALSWVCNPKELNCSAINPGGSHYLPNTLQNHCTWAFDAYYEAHKASQGAAACDFGGTAHLVPPWGNDKGERTMVEILESRGAAFLADLMPADLTCQRRPE